MVRAGCGATGNLGLVRHVALVGMMGSGKTETGRELARRTGRRFWDTDELVVARAGRSIPEIFDAEGEAGFRRLEHEALAEALAGAEPSIVATGGGAVTVAANRGLLAGAVVCWLRARPEVLAGRLAGGSGRPLLGRSGDQEALEERLRGLLAERWEFYREQADVTLDSDDLSLEQVVSALAQRLAGGDLQGAAEGPAAPRGLKRPTVLR